MVILRKQSALLSKARQMQNSSKRLSSGIADVLHHSKLKTYHFQNCLPRLPIPKLEDTMHKYVTSLKALEGHSNVNSRSISDTEKAVRVFMQHDGPELHKLLVAHDRQNPNTSYIAKPWFDMYLESRLPLPLNYNPFLVYKRDPNEPMNDPATRCTNIIVSAVRFQNTLNSEILSPEVYYMKNTAKSAAMQTLVKYLPNTLKLRYIPMALNGAFPLDMSQFENLLNATRIPCQDKDELRTYPKSRHIVAVRNGHFYKVEVKDLSGRTHSPAQIKASIHRILQDKRPHNEDSVAYMTTTDRNTWASIRDHLLDTGNMNSLADVDSAIFCMVLDDTKVEDDTESYNSTFLHGDGASRWFDKSFSLIVSSNGEVGLNFEHAWGDGVAVMRFFNEIFDDTTLKPALTNETESDNELVEQHVKPIKFCLDDRSKQAISEARHRYKSDTGRLRVASCEFLDMNKDYLKKKKVSPDGIMQLAIQVGHYKFFGHPAATYESCSTSAFKHGRTETIRSCTLEAQKAARAIAMGSVSSVNNKLASDESYRANVEQLIRKSCNKHNEITKDAAMGKGFDRHMFGMKNMAERILNSGTPALFKDDSYITMNHIILSTSTLASHAVSMGGFAPVVPDGFGVGYGVRDTMVGCNITSYETRDVQGLVDSIESSLRDIYTVL
uniref:Carnitine O-palmitoyltransferase 2, mitochondrial n=1 Tax=Phallusia mammillata TaxID=59560 RepID=A0A6F9DAT1_9ASCI|nr:carnitine O-palmitoyltransferase 2, mitochondrial [Phallusia mammillata]